MAFWDIPKGKCDVPKGHRDVQNGFWEIQIPVLKAQNPTLNVHFSRFIFRFRNTDALFVLFVSLIASTEKYNASCKFNDPLLGRCFPGSGASFAREGHRKVRLAGRCGLLALVRKTGGRTLLRGDDQGNGHGVFLKIVKKNLTELIIHVIIGAMAHNEQ
jgi:hypothetical protein